MSNRVYLRGIVSKPGLMEFLPQTGEFCKIDLKVLTQIFPVKGEKEVAEALAGLAKGDEAEVSGFLVNEPIRSSNKNVTRSVVRATKVTCVKKKPRIVEYERSE